MPFVVMIKIIHQESGSANLQKLTLNPVPLQPKPVLWFQLSWRDLIIMPFIMVIFRFTLNSFHFNITLNLYQIQKPLESNQLLMIEWTISWNYSTQNTMMIFCMLTSVCFRIDYWSPLLQSFIQSLLCCFIKT